MRITLSIRHRFSSSPWRARCSLTFATRSRRSLSTGARGCSFQSDKADRRSKTEIAGRLSEFPMNSKPQMSRSSFDVCLRSNKIGCAAQIRSRQCRAVGLVPDGQISSSIEFAVHPPLQKYFCFHTPQITSRTLRIPSHTEGRFAIVTDVGYGMRWTRQRFARDGIAGRVERLLSDHRRADERCCCGRQNRVVPTPRRWRQVLRSCVGPTGLRQNISADDGGKRARSPRARHKPLKPLRAGMPGDSGVLVVTRVHFYQCKAHTRPRVQRAPGIPHAL
jgi:hypothetical protein